MLIRGRGSGYAGGGIGDDNLGTRDRQSARIANRSHNRAGHRLGENDVRVEQQEQEKTARRGEKLNPELHHWRLLVALSLPGISIFGLPSFGSVYIHWLPFKSLQFGPTERLQQPPLNRGENSTPVPDAV
jgi:hypothetical protein